MQVQNELIKLLRKHLFSEPEYNVYTVLDGASVPDLLDKLYEDPPEHCCLYRGELTPDLAETAPYLVRLEPRAAFTNWVLDKGWGHHWAIFATAEADLRTMRRHFRTFLMVNDPDGKPLYFRYYDPRVLRVYLPTCNVEEMTTVFGPIASYMLEGDTPNILFRFTPGPEKPLREEVSLLGATSRMS